MRGNMETGMREKAYGYWVIIFAAKTRTEFELSGVGKAD